MLCYYIKNSVIRTNTKVRIECGAERAALKIVEENVVVVVSR